MKNINKALLLLALAATTYQSFGIMINAIGLHNDRIMVNVEKSATTNALYLKFSQATGVPVENIKLISSGTQIEKSDVKTVADYELEKVGAIYFVVRNPDQITMPIASSKAPDTEPAAPVATADDGESDTDEATTTNIPSATAESGEIMIFTKMLTGKTLAISINPHATASELYRVCSDKAGAPVDNIKLILMGKSIPNDGQDIASYNIIQESTLHLVVRQTPSDATPVAAAGAGGPVDEPSTASTAELEAVAHAIINDALVDLESVDLHNLVQVEAKLTQFHASYSGLVQLDFEEKSRILAKILEYKAIDGGIKVIHVLLKHNQFMI